MKFLKIILNEYRKYYLSDCTCSHLTNKIKSDKLGEHMLSFFMSENKYHRYLNIPNYIPDVDFTQWNTDNLLWQQFHKSLQLNQLGNNKIELWLNSLGLSTNWIEVFYTPPRDKGIIHSDNVYGLDWAKLIFQYGAEGSTMRWWQTDKVYNVSTSITQNPKSLMQYFETGEVAGDRVDDHYHGRVLVAQEEQSEMIYEAKIGTSSLANAGILHSSYNPTNEKRFVITIALCYQSTMKRVLWDSAIEILKDYIK